MAGYRALLWLTVALSGLGLLRLPDRDPEVRKSFFRFQFSAAVYGSFAIETGVTRASAPVDVFSDPGRALFVLLTCCVGAVALYWLYAIVAVAEEDGDLVAGVRSRSLTTAVAAAVGPALGASGLVVPPLFLLLAGREANAQFLEAFPSIEAATLNATVSLILIGNVAVFCLTATRRRWLTNSQALPIVLLSFFLGFYDLLAWAASSEDRRVALDAMNANAYAWHLPEAILATVAATLAAALLRAPKSSR